MLKGGLGNIVKQAQQMQENMQKMQEKLASIEVEGLAGAGMVKIVMTCRYDVKRVSIDDSLIGDDKEMLEDLLAAAVNDAGGRGETPPPSRRPDRVVALPARRRPQVGAAYGLPPVAARPCGRTAAGQLVDPGTGTHQALREVQ